jgi:hypothetical protein
MYAAEDHLYLRSCFSRGGAMTADMEAWLSPYSIAVPFSLEIYLQT